MKTNSDPLVKISYNIARIVLKERKKKAENMCEILTHVIKKIILFKIDKRRLQRRL